MPFTAWEIGLKIGATSNAARMFNAMAVAAERADKAVFGVTRGVRAASRAMRTAAMRAESLGIGFGAATTGANTLTAATDRVAASTVVATRRFNALGEAARKAFIGAGVVAGIFAYEGIKGAAGLQTSMTNLSLTTGTYGPGAQNAATRAAMRRMVLDVSGFTAQDTGTIAQEMLVASQGLNNPKRLMAVFPSIAKFADVLQQIKGQDPVEAVRVATSLSHIWGIYSGKPLAGMLDNVMKIALTQPEGLSNVLTQARYFSSAVQLGVPMKDIFSTIALMGQTGFLRGKGGTGFQNLLLGSIQAAAPTAHLSARQAAARRELQLTNRQFDFYDKNRNFRFQPLLDHLAAMRISLAKSTGSPAEFVKDIADLFGKQAAPFITTITSPIARRQQANIHQAMARMPGVEVAWGTIRHNFAFQWQTLVTNLSNLTKAIFGPMIIRLTPGVAALAVQLGRLTNWFEAHPKAGMDVAIGSFGLVGAGAVAAARGLWKLDAAVTALGKSADRAAPATAAEAAASGGVATKAGKAESALWKFVNVLLFVPLVIAGVQGLQDWVNKHGGLGDRMFGIPDGKGGYIRPRQGPHVVLPHDGIPSPYGTPGSGPQPPAGIFGRGKGTFGVPLIGPSGKQSFGVVVPVDQLMADLRLPGTAGNDHKQSQVQRSSQVTIHVDRPTFVLPKGTTREMALAFLKDIQSQARAAMRTGGDQGTSTPNFARLEAGHYALGQ